MSGIGNKDGNIYEIEYFVEVLIYVFLKKPYQHIKNNIDIVKSQNCDDKIDDIVFWDSDAKKYLCEITTNFDGSKERATILKFYLNHRDNPDDEMFIISEDRCKPLKEVSKTARECLNSSDFFNYIESGNAKVYHQDSIYLYVQQLIEYYNGDCAITLKDFIKSYDKNIDDSYKDIIFNYLKKIYLIKESSKHELINLITSGIIRDTDQDPKFIYDMIKVKSLDWSKGIIIKKENLDSYFLEEYKKKYKLMDQNKFIYGEVENLFI